MNNLEMKKPSLDLEVKAEIKGLAKVEDNIAEIKEMALKLQEYYKNTKFIEEGTRINFDDEEQKKDIEEKKKQAKDEKVKVNAFKKAVKERVKTVVDKYMSPINCFSELAKETDKILGETYTIINTQVETVDNQLKAEKINQLKGYYEELATSMNIDFISYERMNQNVTLSASMKSLKEECKSFLEKVTDDLNLIETQEYKAEILAEYKNNLNVSASINTVLARKKSIEEEQARLQAREEQKVKESETVAKVEKVIEAPVTVDIRNSESQQATEEIFKITFTVKGTKQQMINLKEFLKEGGYSYE